MISAYLHPQKGSERSKDSRDQIWGLRDEMIQRLQIHAKWYIGIKTSYHRSGSLSKALHRKWLRGSTKVMPHDVCDNAKAHIWYCKHEVSMSKFALVLWTLKSGVVRSPFSCTHLSSLPGQVQRSRRGCSTMRKQDFLSKLGSQISTCLALDHQTWNQNICMRAMTKLRES